MVPAMVHVTARLNETLIAPYIFRIDRQLLAFPLINMYDSSILVRGIAFGYLG